MRDPREPLQPSAWATWQVKWVTSYMRERVAKDIGLQELTDLLNLSRFHFCTALRLATGHTPHEWLTQQRIAPARVLITNPCASPMSRWRSATGRLRHSPHRSARSSVSTPTEFRRRL